MWGVKLRAAVLAAVFSMLIVPGLAHAGGPGKWTKLATLDNAADTVGMERTADGKLHLVWLAKKAGNGKYSYTAAAVSLGGKLGAESSVLPGWDFLEPDPQLVPDGAGLRLIFEGNKGITGCYFDASVFTATSTNGSAWNLVQGSLDQATVGTGNIAATSELNGTPVATFAGGHLFHVGVDPSCPAATPDGTIPEVVGNDASNPAIVTDSHDGSVWVATFQAFAKLGYWVARILPIPGADIEAPGSAASGGNNNQPDEPVALAARAGGGVYMAYCSAGSTQPCAHIDLWKVGAGKPKVVPGSASTTGARVALAAGAQGRLSVIWYDEKKNVIHAVRTNTSATAFGVVRTIKPPAKTSALTSIRAEGSSGRLDVAIVDELSTGPIELFHTQILAGLSLKANPSKFSHKKSQKVTFTVTDAGQAVAGAKVSCLGKHGQTATSGKVKLAFPKGEAKGKHVCKATKSGYNDGKTTIKVT
jgi:hypothetical protein